MKKFRHDSCFSQLIIVSITCAALLLIPGTRSASADIEQRGFLIPLESISEESLDELTNTWKANILRIQIGNNTRMDGTTGAEYDEMMEERFTLLDEKLPLITARGLQIIFCLSSPPGGLLTRESPSHYTMYSEPALQEDYINKWREIITRYGNHPGIYAFDIENEPAMRKDLVAPGARTWNTLVLDVIAAIREINPTVLLIVKSLYGDPSKLASLPVINDSNVIYAYNSYLYNSYQHTGVTTTPFSIDRPADERVLNSLRRRVSPFFFKMYNRARKKQIPADSFPPRLIVGEVAVSACATESGQFMNSLLSSIETNDSEASEKARNRKLKRWRRAKRRGKSKPKPKFTAKHFVRDVQHEGYTIHAYAESPFWDPRFECDAAGTLTQSSTDTDRAVVVKGFLSRN